MAGWVCARGAGDEVDEHKEEVGEVHRFKRRSNFGASLLSSYARLNANARDDEVRKCNTIRRNHDRNAACRLRTVCGTTPAGGLECATTLLGAI